MARWAEEHFMRFTRRSFIKATSASVFLPAIIGRAWAAEGGAPLPIPEVMDLAGGTMGELTAQLGSSQILQGVNTETAGYSQAFGGPVIRVKRGETAKLKLGNSIAEPVSVHWHGMHIEGAQDGGPHTPVLPNATLDAALDIDQPATTLWYHSHIMERTGAHVWYGLAGMLLVDDPDAADSGLPSTYGEDDIPLVVQDRIFGSNGEMIYTPRGPSLMHGYRGSEIVVNGALRPEASVPAGMVRLRILNGSNARIYHFHFEDGRSFSQVGTDGGLLPETASMNVLTLAPAERAEIIVDFSDGAAIRLLSGPDNNSPMGGMMGGRGGGMMGGRRGGMMSGNKLPAGGDYPVLKIKIAKKASNNDALPTRLTPIKALRTKDAANSDNPRTIKLSMRHMSALLNGRSYKMNDIRPDEVIPVNTLQLMAFDNGFGGRRGMGMSMDMPHPMHLHGEQFQIIKREVSPRHLDAYSTIEKGLVDGGWHDTTLVMHGEKVTFLKPFNDFKGLFMYHCHNLEHEDMGMMRDYLVK
jgi:FtsP/CotA-like multicopper oxidase with cupredoxin domain